MMACESTAIVMKRLCSWYKGRFSSGLHRYPQLHRFQDACQFPHLMICQARGPRSLGELSRGCTEDTRATPSPHLRNLLGHVPPSKFSSSSSHLLHVVAIVAGHRLPCLLGAPLLAPVQRWSVTVSLLSGEGDSLWATIVDIECLRATLLKNHQSQHSCSPGDAKDIDIEPGELGETSPLLEEESGFFPCSRGLFTAFNSPVASPLRIVYLRVRQLCV